MLFLRNKRSFTLLCVNLTFLSLELNMNGARASRRGYSVCLFDNIRKATDVFHGCVELRIRRERRKIIGFLINASTALIWSAPARHSYNRRVRKMCISNSRGEI